MPLLTAAAILVPELIKLGSGIAQKIKAKKLGKGLKRPEYKVPGSVREAVSNARIAAINPEFAGQRAIESKLSASTSAGISRMKEATSSGTELLNTISGLQGQESAGIRDIGISAQQAQVQDMANLDRALSTQAGYEDKAFERNKMQPFEETAAAVAALKGAGAQNIYSAAAGLGKGAQLLGGGAGGDVAGAVGAAGTAEGAATAPTTPANGLSTPDKFKQAFPDMSEEDLKALQSKLSLITG